MQLQIFSPGKFILKKKPPTAVNYNYQLHFGKSAIQNYCRKKERKKKKKVPVIQSGSKNDRADSRRNRESAKLYQFLRCFLPSISGAEIMATGLLRKITSFFLPGLDCVLRSTEFWHFRQFCFCREGWGSY